MAEHEEFRKNSVRVFHDLSYDSKHAVDLYLPPESVEQPEKGYPMFYYVHGGAWHIGNKSGARNPCEFLAREGIACVATSYDLSSVDDNALEILFVILLVIVLIFTFMSRNVILAASLSTLLLLVFVLLWAFLPRESTQHPDHIRAVAKGFRWSKENLGEYGCDTDRMFVGGHSAGGHLATLLCTNEEYLAGEGLRLEDVQGCIGMSGVYSDRRLSQTKIGKELLKSTFGSRETYVDAFPVYNVSPECPPMLLMNAGADIGLKPGTKDLHFALVGQSVWSEVHYYNDLSHWNIYAEWNRGGRNERILNTVLDFMKNASRIDRKNGDKVVE